MNYEFPFFTVLDTGFISAISSNAAYASSQKRQQQMLAALQYLTDNILGYCVVDGETWGEP